jgi:hypothetical protein
MKIRYRIETLQHYKSALLKKKWQQMHILTSYVGKILRIDLAQAPLRH